MLGAVGRRSWRLVGRIKKTFDVAVDSHMSDTLKVQLWPNINKLYLTSTRRNFFLPTPTNSHPFHSLVFTKLSPLHQVVAPSALHYLITPFPQQGSRPVKSNCMEWLSAESCHVSRHIVLDDDIATLICPIQLTC
jgi:hypothetical protein